MEIPKEKIEDKVHSGIKAALNLLPGGGAIAEIFNMVVSPSIEKRREKWMREVVEVLTELKCTQSGIVENLANDEEFLSLLISASIGAYKTHLEEKRKMFKNILQKSIEGRQIPFDMKQVFVNFVDELTISHIKTLKFISNNIEDIKAYNEFQKIYDIWQTNKLYSVNIDLITFRYLLKNLESNGLIYISDDMREINNQVYESEYLTTAGDNNEELPFIRISELGYSFLSYITENE